MTSLTSLTSEDVLAIDRAHTAALLTSDAAALQRMYADDVVHVHYDGRRDDKESYLAPIRTGEVRYTALEPVGTPEVRLLGEVAIVAGDLFWAAETGDGARHDGTIAFTAVWARRDQAVVQVAWHSSPSASGHPAGTD